MLKRIEENKLKLKQDNLKLKTEKESNVKKECEKLKKSFQKDHEKEQLQIKQKTEDLIIQGKNEIKLEIK